MANITFFSIFFKSFKKPLIASYYGMMGISFWLLSGCQTVVTEPKPTLAVTETLNEAPTEKPVRASPTRPTWVMADTAAYPEEPTDKSVLSVLPSEWPNEPLSSGSSYTVQKGDSLWGVSQRFGVTVSELASANDLSTKANLKIGQTLVIPAAGGTMPLAYQASSGASSDYKVRSGDSLSKIAQKTGTSVAALKAMNGLQGDTIRVGQILKIPGDGDIAQMASAEVKVKPVSDLQGATTYTVRPGDTLSGIAARCGVKIADLMAWNGISDARHLQAGQELVMASGHLSQEAMRISPQETEVPAVQVVEYSSVSDDAPESFEGVIVTEVVESHEIVLPEGFGDDSLFDNMEASEVRPLE